jgi:hypothetical protein
MNERKRRRNKNTGQILNNILYPEVKQQIEKNGKNM